MNDNGTSLDAPLTRAPEFAGPPPPRAKPRYAAKIVGIGLKLLIVLLALGLVVVVTIEWDGWVSSAAMQSTDDAYLWADTTPLSTKVSGYVTQVLVHDFQRVKAGDLLFKIEDDDYRAQLAQAEANVAAAQASLQTILQQQVLQAALIKQAEATIEATQADLTRYHLEALRQEALVRTRLAGTPQIEEQAVDNEKHTLATLALNQAQLDQQRDQLTVLASQEKQARATLQAQTALRDLAQITLGYTRITAPVDGMVGQRMVQEGQYLSVGTEVISIVPLPNVWVIANYKETQLERVRIGEPARVTVDTFPGVVLHGHVDSWSPASGAQFSLLPPDNATGNFTKIVQRIPVKIVLDPDPELSNLLRPGMSVIATIDTRDFKARSATGAD